MTHRVALVSARELEDLDAVVIGHLEVRDDHVVLVHRERVERLAAAAHRLDAIARRQLVDEGLADVVVIVDDEDACSLHCGSFVGISSSFSANVESTVASSGGNSSLPEFACRSQR